MPLLEDWRVPSRHAFVLTEAAELVKVPEDVRKCVAFVAYQGSDGLRLAGTAFFVGEPIPDTESHFTYAVTAAHVINGVKARSVDQIVRLRITGAVRGTHWYHTKAADWTQHATDDVAVLNIDLTDERLDAVNWRVGDGDIVTEESIEADGIGVGDDLFFPGLFVYHPGLERNIPIVRTGNIAAMPGEPLHVSYWGKMVAYLVEARSIGGLSGSPVFVHLGFIRTVDGQLRYFTGKHGRFLLLGIMSGHYRAELVEADLALPDASATPEDEELNINMGIGIVVPVQRMMEVIRRPELDDAKAATRKEIIEKERGTAVADTTDGGIEPPDQGEDSFTRTDFEDALRKVSRRKASPPDEGTSGT